VERETGLEPATTCLEGCLETSYYSPDDKTPTKVAVGIVNNPQLAGHICGADSRYFCHSNSLCGPKDDATCHPASPSPNFGERGKLDDAELIKLKGRRIAEETIEKIWEEVRSVPSMYPFFP